MGLFNLFNNKKDNKEAGSQSESQLSRAFLKHVKAAEEGDTEEQYQTAQCYGNGTGCEQDFNMYAYWLEQAAKGGHAEAQYQLAHDWYDNKLIAKRDPAKAAYWYEKAAEQGRREAQREIARCYFNGNGVSQDRGKALYWYEKAAEQGDTESATALGRAYERGTGVSRDLEKAIAWYKKATGTYGEDALRAGDKLTYETDPDCLPAYTLVNIASTFKPEYDEKRREQIYFDANQRAARKGSAEAMNNLWGFYHSQRAFGLRTYYWKASAARRDPRYKEDAEKLSVFISEQDKAFVAMLFAAGDPDRVSAGMEGDQFVVTGSDPDDAWLKEIKKLRGIENASWKNGVLCLEGNPIDVKNFYHSIAWEYLGKDRLPRYLKGFTGNYIDGHYYLGDVDPDKPKSPAIPEGLGRMTYKDGSVYEGEWKNGMRHGKGVFRGSDGSVQDGIWQEGRFLNGTEQKARESSLRKPCLSVCIVGDQEAGKTTLAAAMTVVVESRLDPDTRGLTVEELTQDSGSSFPKRAEIQTDNRYYSLVDCPADPDCPDDTEYGIRWSNKAILVVDALQGVTKQTLAQISMLSAHWIGQVIVVINKRDLMDDPEVLELIEMEVREALSYSAYEDVPVFKLSAFEAYVETSGDAADEIVHLLDTMDAYFDQPKWQENDELKFSIEKVEPDENNRITVWGNVVTGRLKVGDDLITILNTNYSPVKAQVKRITFFGQDVSYGMPGDYLEIHLGLVERWNHLWGESLGIDYSA